ncbi:MAG: 2TM domain-containing protein [Bacteroidetes bacterium]|nr:2TM domain-containing protein [Bacteroidota bacterium]
MQNFETQQDEQLWQLAKKRAAFKKSVISYVLVNTFLVSIWYFTYSDYFWPKWCMLGWGIGLFLQYINAYHCNTFFSAEDEYQKLKQNQ